MAKNLPIRKHQDSRSASQPGLKGRDPFGSEALRESLRDYERVGIQTACEKTTETPADLKTLMVWVNRAGRWERIDAAVQFRKSKRSICRQVVTQVFGLSGKQYEAIRDALEDVHSGDLMGIYKHKTIPGRFAIVLRLPVGDQFANLKIGGAASTGLLVGGAAMWAKGQRGKKPVREVTQEEIEKRWRDAYLLYIMKSHQLLAVQFKIKQLLNIGRFRDNLFPVYHDRVFEMFSDWYGANPQDRRTVRIKSTNQLKQNPHPGAKMIIDAGNRSKIGAEVPSPEQTYVAQLLQKGSVPKLEELQKQLISIAIDLHDDYEVLTKTKEWNEE